MYYKLCLKFKKAYLIYCIMSMLLVSGCHRSLFHERADAEVSCIVKQTTQDSRWSLSDYRFTAERGARFFMPYDRDTPPRPLDDAVAHQFMRCVDGKRAWNGWDRYGVTDSVESADWLGYLPHDENGNVLINRETAIHIARTNSRDYQTALENIYLAALNVSEQRYKFNIHYALGFGGNLFTDDAASGISLDTVNTGAEKLFATGGELITSVANSIVWNFGSTSSSISSTLLNLSLVQPLLKNGGRAVALESLTTTERSFVMSVRQMERFRQGFYVNIIAGDSGVNVPDASASGIPGVGSVPSRAGGLYNLIFSQVQLENQRSNVIDLQDSLRRMEALNDAGRLNRMQVDITRQSLVSAQSALLEAENMYETSLDEYKISLGLPPGLKVAVTDPMLENFMLMSPVLSDLRNQLENLKTQLRQNKKTHQICYHEMLQVIHRTNQHCKEIDADMARLNKILPDRMKALELLTSRAEFKNGQIDIAAVNPQVLQERVTTVQKEYKRIQGVLKTSFSDIVNAVPLENDDKQEQLWSNWMEKMNSTLLELSLVQARIRLDAATLVPIRMGQERALEIARENRLDWMNARTALVDTWRKIEVAANSLKGNLDFKVDGSLQATSSAGVSSTSGNASLGVQFKAPVDRLVERNAYVTALINYDRARRSYMAYEDNMHRNLRSLLRNIELAQLNFELKRISVLVAMSRVDQANMSLMQPPKPNETSQFGDSFARDLVDALQAMLQAQNTFIQSWIDYEAIRMGLDIMLGTFQLDNRGVWIDQGMIDIP